MSWACLFFQFPLRSWNSWNPGFQPLDQDLGRLPNGFEINELQGSLGWARLYSKEVPTLFRIIVTPCLPTCFQLDLHIEMARPAIWFVLVCTVRAWKGSFLEIPHGQGSEAEFLFVHQPFIFL